MPMPHTFFHRFVFVFLIILLFSACHMANNDSVNKEATVMDVYSSSIKPIKLPFKDTCYNTIAVQKVTLPDSLSQFNKYGQLIGKCCGEDEACSGISTVRITKDLHIILKDSTQTFERDKKNADKKYNIQIEKKQREYIIDSTGKIIPLPEL